MSPAGFSGCIGGFSGKCGVTAEHLERDKSTITWWARISSPTLFFKP
jgi:hypothetical protein